MKIQDLKRGHLFRFGKQKKYKRFLQANVINHREEPIDNYGKLVVFYDNCKQIICEPSLEVEVDPLEPIKNYGKSYSTDVDRFPVSINGFETSISYLLKDGQRLRSVYSIKDKTGSWVELDVFDIEEFPISTPEELLVNGINILLSNISTNPDAYMHLFKTESKILIKNLRKLDSLVKRRCSSFSMTTEPKNDDGNYILLLNLENEIDDDVKKEFENIPSVKIEYRTIPADNRGFTHQYVMIVDDKKSEW